VQAHRRADRAEDLAACERSDADQVDERVDGKLLERAVIARRLEIGGSSRDRILRGRILQHRVGESHNPWLTSRRGRGIDRSDHDRRGLRVEKPGDARHAVGLRDQSEIAPGAETFFALRDAGRVAFVAEASRMDGKSSRRDRRGIRDQLLLQLRRLDRADRVRRIQRQLAGRDRVRDDPGGSSDPDHHRGIVRGQLRELLDQSFRRPHPEPLRETGMSEFATRAVGDLRGDPRELGVQTSSSRGERALMLQQLLVIQVIEIHVPSLDIRIYVLQSPGRDRWISRAAPAW